MGGPGLSQSCGAGPLTFRMRTVMKATEKMIIILMNWLWATLSWLGR